MECIEKGEYEYEPGPFLVDQINNAKDAFVRAKAITLWAQKRPDELINVATGLYDEDPRVRATAAKVIATSKNIRSFWGLPFFKEGIIKAKSDQDKRVRHWANQCLKNL